MPSPPSLIFSIHFIFFFSIFTSISPFLKMTQIPVKWLFIFFSSYLAVSFATNTTSPKKTYIIQIDKWAKPEVFTNHIHWYTSLIRSVTSEQLKTGKQEVDHILYTYHTAFHGVAAQLSPQEVEKLQQKSSVIAVFPENVYQLHTTRSPTFLGLESVEGKNVRLDGSLSNDVIVGVLDTGIWPESGSFNDTGMTPVPSNWKGSCETRPGFVKHHCNKKIIGAKVFYHGYEASAGKINGQDDFKSPRDQDGHGTHTAATAVGSSVKGANFLGFAYGTATGMAPGARVAVYKVCWVGGCFSSDILSAVDQAVSDGVNVLSISLGGVVSSYYKDSLSVATFGAIEKGIFVSCSAGNGGPDPVSLTNVSPWITTVGASTIDREFPAIVKLGNGKLLKGASLYNGKRTLLTGKQYPLVYLGDNSTSPTPTSLCLEGTLDKEVVFGKIVICDRGINSRVQKGQVVKDAGGVGMILSNTANNGEELVADSHLLPALAVGYTTGNLIKHYASRNKGTANLEFLGTKLGIKPSPVVAAFSSRGPNLLSLEILKPDMVAPGVNILAAWTGEVGPSGLSTDHRRTKFNILSGTSMSCPHVSGIAALIKSKHPNWSPSAIKSALMTTAYVHDNTYGSLKDSSTGAPSTPYDHGAGHINPMKALDPGLIYDIGAQDYFDFLCAQSLTTSQLSVFAKFSKRTCQHSLATPGDLNYPAISAVFTKTENGSVILLHRTVTNVGPPVSDYHVAVSPFKSVLVKVEPEKLNFTEKNQKLSYKVIFKKWSEQTAPEFGNLIWKSKVHRVRSSIVVTSLPPL